MKDQDIQTQQSYEHETTGDAGTAPGSKGDSSTTRQFKGAPEPHPTDGKRVPEPAVEMEVLRDETDDGGPLVIHTDDPKVLENLAKLPKVEFPGEGVPEIDLPVEKR